MATIKHPDAQADRSATAHETSALPQNLEVPENLRMPHEDPEAARADKERRDAAAAAFRNEKAHEPPPRHQA